MGKNHVSSNHNDTFELWKELKDPNDTKYVDNRYLGIVRNVETIKSTNFGQLTLDHRMACVRKFANGAANLEGNLPLLQDEEDRAVPAASKESLKNISQLYKDLYASQGAPSLDSRKHSKATTILEAFLDPLNFRHNKNVRKSEERRNQDDEDFSIEVVDAVIEIMRHDHPEDTRDVQLVYIEGGRRSYARKRWFSYQRTLRTPTGFLWS
ncbi:hypothetical protein D1007_24847 [Hordeum vulgare]|nr:hypothetical protein D1007_24847 [Hordeum vulgare]